MALEETAADSTSAVDLATRVRLDERIRSGERVMGERAKVTSSVKASGCLGLPGM